MAEEREPGPGPPDRGQQHGAAPLHPPGHGVVEQFGYGGRYVRAQHIDLAHRVELGRVLVLVDLVRRVVARPKAAAHEAERPTAQLDPAPVQHLVPGLEVAGPHGRDVDVAVGQVGGLGQRGEQVSVLGHGGGVDRPPDRAFRQARRQPRGQLPGLVEPLGQPQGQVPLVLLRAEQVGEDAAPVVGVVQEQQQVPQADERVRPAGRGRQRVEPAMDVAHQVNPHAPTLSPGRGVKAGRPDVALIRRHRAGLRLPVSSFTRYGRGTQAREGDSVVRQHSIPALVEISGSDNLAAIVPRRAADDPRQIALRRKDGGQDSRTWRDVTVGEFRDDVPALAKGLIAAGIGTGDRVALMSRTPRTRRSCPGCGTG